MVENKSLMIIEGMTEDTAKRYVELRKYVDDRLLKVSSLGKVIEVLGYNEVEIGSEHLANVGELIDEMSVEVWKMLDEFISCCGVKSKLCDQDKK